MDGTNLITFLGKLLEGRIDVYPHHLKGGDTLTVFEAIIIALTFGRLLVALIKLVIDIVKNMKK